MQDFTGKKVLLGICGSVAAYKALLLLRELQAQGAEVRVVMTKSATQFVTPHLCQALSGYPVYDDLFDSEAERGMGHIALAKWADYLVVAPITANMISKFAHGIADDLLSTLYLVARCPVYICPAMNHNMWQHPAIQDNVTLLKQRGVRLVGPERGLQACQDEGPGRLCETEDIIEAMRLAPLRCSFAGQRVVVTAGPTREAIDGVRYLTNHSSGKMGYALARALAYAGAEVILISGPCHLPLPLGVQGVWVSSAQEMKAAVMEALAPGDIFIATAAVADFRVEMAVEHKIKKQKDEGLTLHLVQNPDILQAVVASKMARYVVGFAAETQDVIEYAKEKLARKQLDMIVANQVGPSLGFNQDGNAVWALTKTKTYAFAFQHKTTLAADLVTLIAKEALSVQETSFLA